jgi:hypothetical protein
LGVLSRFGPDFRRLDTQPVANKVFPCFLGSLRMSLQHLSDASITAFYENIRQQVEIDRSSKHRLTAGEAVRQRADELHNELMRRRLHSTPIKW